MNAAEYHQREAFAISGLQFSTQRIPGTFVWQITGTKSVATVVLFRGNNSRRRACAEITSTLPRTLTTEITQRRTKKQTELELARNTLFGDQLTRLNSF